MNSEQASGPGAAVDTLHFRTFGFTVLRRFFEPGPLAAEITRALQGGLVASPEPIEAGGIHFRYVPMMTAETPISLSLLDRLEPVAKALLGGPVIPTRAKGTRYSGNSPWHVDSTSPVASAGFAAYLSPLTAENGALRLLPGSHRAELGGAIRALLAEGTASRELPGYPVVTEPGDVIAFDEHLFHASFGGDTRLQWRLDYLRDPADAASESATRAYFAGIYSPEWDGRHDVDRYPSYDAAFRSSNRPFAARLDALGVYEMAARQEAFARSKR